MPLKKSIGRVMAGVGLVFLFYFSSLPILSVLFYGVSADGSRFTSAELVRILGLLRNSLCLSAGVTAAAVTLAVVAAFTLGRLQFKGQRFLRLMMLLPLVSPTFVGSLALIMLFGKRGLISHSLLHLNSSIYGWHGVFFLQVLGLTTVAYLVISGAVRGTDTVLEDAARNLGLSEGRIFFQVTLPMMLPEISAAALLTFLASMADFTTPLIIGGGFRTLASDLYVQITGLYDIKTASITGIFLLVPCFFAFLLQRFLTDRKKYESDLSSHGTVLYVGVSSTVRRLLIALTVLLTFAFCMTFLFTIVGAFTKAWGYDYTFTLDNLRTVLGKNPKTFVNPLRNSILLAVVTGFSASLLGTLLAYGIYRGKLICARFTDFICLFPAAVPGILFGIGYLVTFKYSLFGIGQAVLPSFPTIVLLGSSTIIYLICIARNINVSMKSCYALLEHIDPDLENAAYNLGASHWYTVLRVTLPLLKDAFSNSYIRVFSGTMTTLGAIIFLLLPKDKVAIQIIFQSITSEKMGVSCVMALTLSGITLLLMLLFYTVAYWKEIRRALRRPRHEN